MKKTLLILPFLIFTIGLFGQSKFPSGVLVGNDTLATKVYVRSLIGGSFYDSTLMASVKRLKDTATAIRNKEIADSGILQTAVGLKADTSKVTQQADYVIEKIGSTVYARPGYKTGLPAYSNSSFNTVITSAMGQLTTGGIIYLNSQIDTGLSSILVPYDHITLQGADKYLTKLKLKASADIGSSFMGLIDCSNANYFTLKDVELDGNGANQTKIDNKASATAICSGILALSSVAHNIYTKIDNCYIHDFTQSGIWLGDADLALIQNCRVSNNYWNNISVGLGDLYCRVYKNYLEGSCDVSISPGGQYSIVEDNIITDMGGTHGTGTQSMGIGLEAIFGGNTFRNRIINNTITGAHINSGIQLANVTVECTVSGNDIYDLSSGNTYGIRVDSGSYITISNNKINRVSSNAISVHSTNSTIENNDIDEGIGNLGIALQGYSKFNKIISNNVITTSNGVYINATSDSNYVVNNIISGAVRQSLTDLGTNNVYRNNYSASEQKWIQESGSLNTNKNPTSDGLGAGLLIKGSQFITVYSYSNANDIISLPTASASTVGTVIRGAVPGTYGFKLQVIAAQSSTVYINGVTTNVKAAIPVNSTFEVVQIDATHWILKVWSSTGDTIVIIPV